MIQTVLLETVVKPNVSGVARLAMCRGLQCRSTGPRTTFISANFAGVIWFAFYGREVESNRWEPYDQPSAAAYMPLPLSKFSKSELGRRGIFLLQNTPRVEPIRGTAVSDGKDRRYELLSEEDLPTLRLMVGDFLRRSGVPSNDVQSCVESIIRRHSTLAKAMKGAACLLVS